MKVLWITNVELNNIANVYGDTVVVGGWLEQTAKLLVETGEVELSVACNSNRVYSGAKYDGITFYSFNNLLRSSLKLRIHEIIQSAKPDIVHIWGTEYIHSLAAAECCLENGLINKAVVSIQGLVSICPIHYFANLPERVIHHHTLKEFVRPNLYKAREIMKANGENEKKVLNLVNTCIGRTDWDFACVKQINPQIRYCAIDEILREAFYDAATWSYESCSKHTVFFSQATYPVKGFHTMLLALEQIKKLYPDVIMNVLGADPFKKTLPQRFKRDSYEKYLMELIQSKALMDNVKWLGTLDAGQMVSQYLNANVFVCSSSIENSSNSIGEAMLLGVPTVASDVGGIKSYMTHEKEGVLFHDEAYYMLADAVCRIFSDPDYAGKLGRNARLRALKIHDRDTNTAKMMALYSDLAEG